MSILLGAIRAALLCKFFVALTPALAQPPARSEAAAPTDAELRELEQQIKSLQQQLDQINATRDAAPRQRLMQLNWQGMQNYMGQMHDRWGMGYPWSAGYPWMRMGPGMMSGGRVFWPVPNDLTPDQYVQQMGEQMKLMQEQMNKIAQASDPQERQHLMQEQWQTMYQQMQTMRGMGWMLESGPMMGHAPMPSAKALPDADSAGAKLISMYCVQCHAAPQPTLLTAKDWTGLTQRMHIRMEGGWPGVKTPTEQDMKTIVAYMQKHARQ
ncbi:MAG TPA: hypothetical protein VEN29_11860 [Casimicrobiaceae bacterium]|nr:hypothetical protein [Casimicrobiaceae bacterium]